MANQKSFYYVLVYSDGKAKFVTSIEEHSVARWASDKKPLQLSKSSAESIAYGLNLNLTPAMVVKSFYELNEQIFAK